MPAEPILLRDTKGDIWEKVDEGLRAVVVDGKERRGPLVDSDDVFEIEYRYGPLVPVKSLGLWLSR